MKYSILTILTICLFISSCSTENPCVKKLATTVNQTNLYAEATMAIIKECGSMDPVDIQITRTPLFSEIVNLKEFSSDKYDIQRFITDFERFKKNDKYRQLRNTLVYQTKTYSEADWSEDKKNLIELYHLSPADATILETIVKNPANASMSFPDAFKEIMNVKVQKALEQAQQKQNAQ